MAMIPCYETRLITRFATHDQSCWDHWRQLESKLQVHRSEREDHLKINPIDLRLIRTNSNSVRIMILKGFKINNLANREMQIVVSTQNVKKKTIFFNIISFIS